MLRCHLALRVPGPCRLRVEDATVTWEEGKVLVFDDTCEHEAWNDGDDTRVVLFVDFVRPSTPRLETRSRALVRAIARSPYIRHARAQNAKWEAEVGRELERQRGRA